MNHARLIHDANEIAKYFAAYPHAEAIAGIADHLAKFWDPRMRSRLKALVDEPTLHALVRAAIPALKA